MPKATIRQAATWVTQQLRSLGKEGVWVPRRGRERQCDFSIHARAEFRYVWIPFDVLVDLLNFSLDNAILRMPNGSLWKQEKGVPMGDAISPGATIIALAYMKTESCVLFLER